MSIMAEYDHAKRKHPGFINFFTSLVGETRFDFQGYSLDQARKRLKERTDKGIIDFESVLLCEVCEATYAYSRGELAHAQQELAQCAAVCIRGMEFIQAEIDKRAEKEG